MFLRWSMLITKGIAYLFTNLLSFLIGYLLAKELQRHMDKQQQLMGQYDSCPQKVTALCNVIRISCSTRDSETQVEFYFYICFSKDSSFLFTYNCSDHLKPSHEWDKRNPFTNPVEQKDYFQDGRSSSLFCENEPVTSHLLKKDSSQLSTIVRHKVPLPFVTSRKDLSGTFLKELYRPPEPPPNFEAPLQKCFNVGETVLSLEHLRLLTNLCKHCACVCYDTVKELCLQHSYFKHKFNHRINTFLKELKNSAGAEFYNEIISKERIVIKGCCSNTRVYLEYKIVPEEEANKTSDIFFGNLDHRISHRNVMKRSQKSELKSDIGSSEIKLMSFMNDYENFPRKQTQGNRIHLKNVSLKKDLENIKYFEEFSKSSFKAPHDFTNYNSSSKQFHSNNSVNALKQNVLLRNVRNLSNTTPKARMNTSEILNLKSNVVEEPTTATVKNNELENSKSADEVLIDGELVNIDYFPSIDTNNDAVKDDETTMNSELSFTNLNPENVEFSTLDKDYVHELKNISSSGTRGDTEIQNKDSSTLATMDSDVFQNSKTKTNEEESTFNSITEFVKFYSKEAAESSIQNNIFEDKLDNAFSSSTFLDYLTSQNSDFSTMIEINKDELENTVNSNILSIVTDFKNNTEKDKMDGEEIKTPQNSITSSIDFISENYNHSIISRVHDSELLAINNSEASFIDFNEKIHPTTFEIENNSSNVSQNSEGNFVYFQPEITESTSMVETQDPESDEYYTKNKMNEDGGKSTFNYVTGFLKINSKVDEYSTVAKTNDDEVDNVQTSEREFVDLNLQENLTMIRISNDKGKSTVNPKAGKERDSENFVTRIDKTNNEELKTSLNSVTGFIDLTSENNNHLTLDKINNELKTLSTPKTPTIDENSDENRQLITLQTNYDDTKTNISLENGLDDLRSENYDPSVSFNAVNEELNSTHSPTGFTYFKNSPFTTNSSRIYNNSSLTNKNFSLIYNLSLTNNNLSFNTDNDHTQATTDFIKLDSKNDEDSIVKTRKGLESTESIALGLNNFKTQNTIKLTSFQTDNNVLKSTLNSVSSFDNFYSERILNSQTVDGNEELKRSLNFVTGFHDFSSEKNIETTDGKIGHKQLETTLNTDVDIAKLTTSDEPSTPVKNSDDDTSVFSEIISDTNSERIDFFTSLKSDRFDYETTVQLETDMNKLNSKQPTIDNELISYDYDANKETSFSTLENPREEAIITTFNSFEAPQNKFSEIEKNTPNDIRTQDTIKYTSTKVLFSERNEAISEKIMQSSDDEESTKYNNDKLSKEEEILTFNKAKTEAVTTLNKLSSSYENTSENNTTTSRKSQNDTYLEKEEESTPSHNKNFTYGSTIDKFSTNVLTDVQSATKESKNANDISSVRTERDIRISTNDVLDLNEQIKVVTTRFPFLVTFFNTNYPKTEHLSDTNLVTSTETGNNYGSTIDEFPTNVLTDVQSATKESKIANDISSVRTERDIRISTNDVLDLNEQIKVVTTNFPFLVTFFNTDYSKTEHLSDTNLVASTKTGNNYGSTIDEFPTNVLTDVQSATKESKNANDISSVRTERDIRISTNDVLDLNEQIKVVTTNFPFLVTFFNTDYSKTEHLSDTNLVTSTKTGNNNYGSTTNEFPTKVLTDVQSPTKESKNANDISSVRTERDIRISTNDMLDLNEQITDVTKNIPFLVTFFNSDDSKIESLSQTNPVTSTKTDNNIYLDEESTRSHDKNFNYASTINEFPTNILTDVQSATKESKNANDISSVRTERDIPISTNDMLDLNEQITEVTKNIPFLVTFFNSDYSKIESLSQTNPVTSTKTDNNIYFEKEESTHSHDKNFNFVSTINEFPTNILTDVQSATKESKNANDISSARTERDIRISTKDVLDLNEQITVVTTNFPFLVTFFNSDDSKIDRDGPKETEMKVPTDDIKPYPGPQEDFEDVTKLQKTMSTEELSSLISDKNVDLSTWNNPRTFSDEIDTDSSRSSQQALEDFGGINFNGGATFTTKNDVSTASLSSTNKFTSPSVKTDFFTKKEFVELPATDLNRPSSEFSFSDFQTKEMDTYSSKYSKEGLEDFGGINFNGEATFTTKNNDFPAFLSSTNQFTNPSVKIEFFTKKDMVPASSEFSSREFETKATEQELSASNTVKTKGESSFTNENPLTEGSLSSIVNPTSFSYSTLNRPEISIKVTTPELSEITLNDKISTPNFGVTKNVPKGETSSSLPKGTEVFSKFELSSTMTNRITNTDDKMDTDLETPLSIVNPVSGSNLTSTESIIERFTTNKKTDVADGIPTTEVLKQKEYTSEGSTNNPTTYSINQYDITPHPFTSISTTVSSTMKEAVLNNNSEITEHYVPTTVQTESKINSDKELFSKDIDVTDRIEAKNSVSTTQFYVTNENNILIPSDTTIVSAKSEIISPTTELFLESTEKYSSTINRDEDSTTSLNLNSSKTNDQKEVLSSDSAVITSETDKTVLVTDIEQLNPKTDHNRQTSSDGTTLDVRSEVSSFTSKIFTQSSEKYPSTSNRHNEITTTLIFLTQPNSNDEKPYSKDITTQYVSEKNTDSFTDKTIYLKSTISSSTEDKMSTLEKKVIEVATENTSPKTDSMLLPEEENTSLFAKDLITELNENDLFPLPETDISTEVDDSVSEEILIRTDRDVSFPVDEDVAIPSYKTKKPPATDEDKTSSVEETPNSSTGYDVLTDDSKININEFDGVVSTEEQVITNNEVRIQPTEDFPLKEIDITEENEETTFPGKELIRTEREILSSSQVSGLESRVPDIEIEKSSVDVPFPSVSVPLEKSSVDVPFPSVSVPIEKSSIDIPFSSVYVPIEMSSVDGASDLSLGGNIGISVNADISTELNFKTSSKNIPFNTDEDDITVQETTEKTSVEIVKMETSTKTLGETSSADLPKTLLKTSATPSAKETTHDAIPMTEGREISTIQNVFVSTTTPKSSTEEKKVSETVTSENQRVSSTTQETTVRSTQRSEMSSSMTASTSSSTSSSTNSPTVLTSTSKKTEVSSSSRVEMASPSPNADKTTASASETSTIPFHFTIDANYDEIVGRRKKEFEDHLASQLVVVMRIPSQCLENLKVSKGSIEVNFDLSPNSEYGHMADEKALKAAADELKRMIDSGQLNLNDLEGNTMVIIPIDPPTKAPIVNQTEHTTIILGVVISAFIITVIAVAVAAIIIKRKHNMTQRLSPIEEMRSKMPSYREIPFQEALFMKGPAKNKLMLGKYCYDTGKWMGPGPEPVPYQPPESAVYRPPTDTEIRQTPRPPTSVFDSPERNVSGHRHMDLKHQQSEPSRSDPVNRLKKRERKIKNRLGT